MALDDNSARTPITPHDAWETLVRRRWLVGGGLFLCWLLVWCGSWLLPSVYRSETVILIEQQKVPEEYVVANVSVDLKQRLEAMTQQTLSRTRLQHIIEQFGLYKDDYKANPDEVIEQMRTRDIKIEPRETPGKNGQLAAFSISYRAPTARLAQQVNAQLTSLFIDQNIEEQSQRAEGTTEFLSSELQSARDHLNEQESKIKQFKAGNLGQLPSQMETNVHILSGLQERQQSLSQALNRAQEQRLYYESLLTQYRSVNKEQEKGGNNLPAIDEQLSKLKEELADAQAKYTPDHPDVLRLKRLIARTEKQRDDIQRRLAEGGNDASTHTHDPRTMTPILQFESQLKANQQEIADIKRDLAQVETQISGYQGRLNNMPIREQQLADLMRDYDQSKANYDSLLKKQMQSQLATNLEKRQQGEQFRIIDPPSLPKKPVSPDRLKLSLMGLAGGLLLGLGLAISVEAIEDKVRTEDEVTRLVKVRILAGVPHLFTPQEESKRKIRRVVEWSAAAVMLVVMVAANAYTSLGR